MKNTRATVRHGRLRRSSAFASTFRLLLSLLLALAISGVAVMCYAVFDLTRSIKTVELEDQQMDIDPLNGSFNMLVVGSDSRKGQTSVADGESGELNDVNILLHIAADHKSMTAVSFPRDLLVDYPACSGPNGEKNYYPAVSGAMLNESLDNGLPCVVKVIEKLTGAKIPFVGLVSFDGVVNMSNALGGVEVCLDKPLVDYYTELNLPAGEVSLVGKQALQFLRTRHGVGSGGDLSRISNQQIFLSALARKIKSGDSFTNPAKMYSLARAAVENMTLSSNMKSPDFMLRTMATMRTVELDKTVFAQFPVVESPYDHNRVVPDKKAAKSLMTRVLNDMPIELQRAGDAVAEDPKKPAQTGATAPANKPATGATANGAGTDNNDAGAAGATGTSGATGSATSPLPETVTGQRASDVTCSAGTAH